MFNPQQGGFILRQFLLLGLVMVSLSACSGNSGSTPGTATVTDAFDAATGSLEDLNLKRKDIPALLKKTAIDPYASPAKMDCTSIHREIVELDMLLGPDMRAKEVEVASNDDTFMAGVRDVKMPTTDEAIEGGQNLTHDAVVSLVRSQTSFLPFRSIIRRITGADRHQRNIEEAFQAGKIRRAYLKGVAESHFGKRCLKTSLPPDPTDKPEKPAAAALSSVDS